MSFTQSSRLLLGAARQSQRIARCQRTPYLRPHLQSQTCRPFSSSQRRLDKKYTEEHEWIELEGEANIGTIGISEYAAKALGDVVYVELPDADQEVAKGDTIGAVESVKSASDIMTPVAGKIVDTNKVLEEKPATINKSPEGDGWIAKIEIASKVEIDSLMDKAAYDKFTGEQEGKQD